MKRSIGFLVLSIGIAGLSGCDSNNSAPAATGPSAAFVAQMQSQEGCLDAAKALRAAYDSHGARSVLVDATVANDNSQVSDAFARSVVHNTTAESLLERRNFEQRGCDSIVENLDGNELRLKIVDASPTRIVTEQSTAVADRDNPVGYQQITFELTADNQLMLRNDIPYTTPHECSGQEYHQVALTFVVDWANPLPPAPSASENLQSLQERAHDYEDAGHADYERGQEERYCHHARRTF